MDGLLPPPPPPFVIVDPLPLAVDPNNFPPPDSSSSSSSSISLGSTLLIITAVLGFSFVVCLFIPLGFGLRLRRSSALVARTDPSDFAPEELTNKNRDDNNSAPIVSHLPLFKVSSSLATHSKSSPDCAVCLHSFLPDEHIRRLPACGHAFHAECVDTWIRNSPSCPLCRTPVASPPPPSATAPPVKMTTSGSQGGSSVWGESRNLSLPPFLASPPRRHFYSTGSSIDNLMEEDVEAAVARIWEQSDYEASASVYRGPSPQRDEIGAAMSSGGRRGRNLMDSMDGRLSSQSPSFRSAASSFRHSIPSTDQEEDHGGEAGQDFFWNWEAEEDRLSAVYRWITGA